MYQMLCGRLPFSARETRELFRQIREDAPQPPRQLAPDLPIRLEAICLKAVAKEQADRYTTAADMARELRQVLASHSHEAVTQVFADPTAGEPTQGATASRTSPSLRRPREAERRQITVLFSKIEITGGLGGHEPLDIEEQDDLIQEFREHCAQVVERFEGTVVPTAIEEIQVCFGYPVAEEDAPLRAVRTGLEMMSELSRRNEQLQQRGVRFDAWVAILTAPAVVGESASPPGGVISVVGEAPLVATRLEGLSQTKDVLVSGATHKLIEGFFRCESLGACSLRGVAEPIEVFRVLGESEAQTRIEVAEQRGLTPLVGRDLEVAMLQKHWSDVCESMGHVVLLTGDAGLGKSRLIHALREFVHQQGDEPAPLVIEWRCSPYYQNTGLYPLADYLEHLCEIRRDALNAERLEKLIDCVQRHKAGRPEEAVPLLAALLSIDVGDRYPPLRLSPMAQKQRTLDLIVNWLGSLADQQPVLFIVEDLHWADASTLELLEQLIDPVAGQRILTVLSCRPEFRVPWATRAHQSLLALNRLRKQEVAALMQLQTGSRHLPPAIVEQIIDRTGGIPLFVEEYTKMLLETGGLKVADGELERTSSFTITAIPATLQDLLMARLDRMRSVPEVIQLGAALGRYFSFELIREVAELDEALLLEELGKNATVRLFFVLRGMWTWRLLRDELDRCCELCDQVLELAATPECRDFRAEAHFLPGNTYYYRGDFQRSLQHLQAGWELFDLDQSRDFALRTGLNYGVTILGQMALALWQLGYCDQAFQRVTEAIQLAEKLDHPFSRAFALYHRRRLQQYSRMDDAVEESIQAELALAREQRYVFREAQALMCQAACLVRNGQLAESRAPLQQGEAMYQACGARLSLTQHFSYLADIYLDAGLPDEAAAALDKATAVLEQSTERYLEAEVLRLRGRLLLARSADNAAEAESCYRQALDIARQQDGRSRQLRVATSWAQLMHQQGKNAEAAALLRPLYDWFTEGLDTPPLVEARRLLDQLT